MIDANSLAPLSILIPLGLAFSKSARYELLKRDRWTCQAENCFGNYVGLGDLNWGRDWNVNAAHEPDLHKPYEDHDINNGRCLCVTCHIIEEINRYNYAGAGFLWQKQTIRNRNYLQKNSFKDMKMDFSWYMEFAEADEEGKQGLALAFIEKFNLQPIE